MSSRFILPIAENLNCAPRAISARGVATAESDSITLNSGVISVSRQEMSFSTNIARMPSIRRPSRTLSIKGFFRMSMIIFFALTRPPVFEKPESEITARTLKIGTAKAESTDATSAPGAPHREVASGMPISAKFERNIACITTPRLVPSLVIHIAMGIANAKTISTAATAYATYPRLIPASESILYTL